ncbi:hypothetical protein FLA_4653 [Filimonas lacunae]|nr:hypothetical protein FLA_4653 [Filimonas lacunae]
MAGDNYRLTGKNDTFRRTPPIWAAFFFAIPTFAAHFL